MVGPLPVKNKVVLLNEAGLTGKKDEMHFKVIELFDRIQFCLYKIRHVVDMPIVIIKKEGQSIRARRFMSLLGQTV